MFKFFCVLLPFVIVLFPAVAVSGDIGNEIISDELPAESPAVRLSVPLAPLGFMIGSFTTEVRTKDNPRQQNWHLADGELISEIILAGKAIRLHYRGQIVELPFEGIGIISYSSETGQYQSYWIDDFSGQASFYSGIVNSDSSVVFEGTESEFGREVWFRVTYQSVDSRRWISKYDRSEDGRYFWHWMKSTTLANSQPETTTYSIVRLLFARVNVIVLFLLVRDLPAALLRQFTHIGDLVKFVENFSAKNLLDNILKGYDAGKSAEFINHDKHLLTALKKHLQHFVEACFLLYEMNVVCQFHKSYVSPVFRNGVKNIAAVDDPFDVLRSVSIYRHTAVGKHAGIVTCLFDSCRCTQRKHDCSRVMI